MSMSYSDTTRSCVETSDEYKWEEYSFCSNCLLEYCGCGDCGHGGGGGGVLGTW